MGLEEIREKLKQKIQNPIKDPTSYEILKHPELLDLLIQECGTRIVGEKDTIKTILLCSSGRLVENCTLSSYNLMVSDESGTGKDFVTSNVLKIMPKELVEKRTRISPKVFTYWHNSYFEPDWDWNGMVCYLEDVSNGVLNNEVFKVMCSSGSFATIVKDGKAIDIKINGKPVIIVTTYSSTPSSEMLRRFTILNLDSSEDQTKAIMNKQLDLATKGKTINYNEKLTKALKYLKRVKVTIPFAKKLKGILPTSIIMRTHNERFLDYIRASAALFQYQRKTDKEGFLIAEGEDYDNARDVLIKTTSNQNMVPLTKNQKLILQVLISMNGWFTINELTSKINLSDNGIRNNLDTLVKTGLVQRDVQTREDSFKPVTVFQAEELINIKLPTWEGLNDKMSE